MMFMLPVKSATFTIRSGDFRNCTIISTCNTSSPSLGQNLSAEERPDKYLLIKKYVLS